jgi:hypothetical protein
MIASDHFIGGYHLGRCPPTGDPRLGGGRAVLDQEGQFARLGRSRGKSSQAGRQSCPALRTLVRQCLYLALDVSVIKGTPFVLIRVSLIYRGRAIPLAWRVLCHASASVSFSDYEPVTRPSLCVFARWPRGGAVG